MAKEPGHGVNWRGLRRLMAMMGLRAIYRRPSTNQPARDHKVYPYLL